jgi:hypothetical protein
MEVSRRILFYGNSLILGTLVTSLRKHSQFQVTILLPPFPGKQRIEELKPDAIFFDLEADRPEAAVSLLESFPDLLLIGVSPDSNMVKMWTGCQLRELSTQELVEVINEQLRKSSNYLLNKEVKI